MKCEKCPSFNKLSPTLAECKKYGFVLGEKVWKQRVCEDYEK